MNRHIVIADDHFLIRSGLRILLESEPDLRVIGEAADGPSLLEILADRLCDLVILDLTMPALDRGLSTLSLIRQEYPSVAVLVLTVHKNQETIARALNLGARGYVIKEEAEGIILGAVRKVLSGEIAISTGFSGVSAAQLEQAVPESAARDESLALLSGREQEVLHCVARGYTSKRIGAELGISHTTVNKHVEHIKQKLGINRKAGLIRFALMRGIHN
ncbi:MAG: response regulator transcription factor [Leptospirales bacterium]|jgi:two-component system response regulator NreC